MTQGPSSRVLITTLRERLRGVSDASAYEFEDTVVALENASLSVVRGEAPHQSTLELRVLERLRRHAGITVQREPKATVAEEPGLHDLWLLRLMTPHDIELLPDIDIWRRRARLSVCWVEELWGKMLQFEKLIRPLKRFDQIFVGHATTAEKLSKLIGRPCHYLAPGVDALRFCPYPDPPARPIDVYMLGRRSADTHRTLLERAAQQKKFWYLYDSAKLTFVTEGPIQHRDLVASLIQRTRYFVVNRAKMNAPDQTDGQQEFGPRYFEGAAGGAVLVGDAPDAGPFSQFFDWPDAVFRLPYGTTALPALIDELDRDPARIERARRANVRNVLLRHDWLYRWQEILDAVGLPATQAMAHRRQALADRAAPLRD